MPTLLKYIAYLVIKHLMQHPHNLDVHQVPNEMHQVLFMLDQIRLCRHAPNCIATIVLDNTYIRISTIN